MGSPLELKYGDHPRHRLLVWRGEGEGPRPALVFFHGGGFSGGEPSGGPLGEELVPAGVTVIGAGYRLKEDKVTSREVMFDGARAIQHVRANAAELGVDPKRIAAMGNSAGGHIAAWLGYHRDIADDDGGNPLERESSRVNVVALMNTQPFPFTLDDWVEYTGCDREQLATGIFAFVEEVCAGTWFEEPVEVSSTQSHEERDAALDEYRRDTAAFLLAQKDAAPTLFLSEESEDPEAHIDFVDLHSPMLMIPLKRKLDVLGVPTMWGDGPEAVQFLLRHLNGA